MVKRNLLSKKSGSLVMFASLLMSTLTPIASASVSAAVPTTVHFTGQPAEWASVTHDSVTAASSLQLIKAIQSGGKLHVLVKGTNVSNQGTFYIDADNNPATGEPVTGWKNSGGIDYKITGDKLYQYSSGAWAQIGTVPYANTQTIAETEVGIDLLGLPASAPMKVAYSQSGFNAFLPDVGKDMLGADTEVPAFGPDANITVDANTDDWAGLQPIATTADSVTTSVYAVMNNERLSVLITGKVGDWNDFLIDTDNNKNTGFFAPSLWPNQGFDYLIENGADGAVYKSHNAGWAWDSLASLTDPSVQYAESGTKDNKTIEVSIPISLIGLTAPRTLYIGFDGGNSGQRAPKVPGAAAKVIPALPKVTVDGNDADWAGITPIAAGTGGIVDFSSFIKDKKVYAFAHYHGDVSTTPFRNLFIDSDNSTSTGYQQYGAIPATGSDYMVQNGKLYKYTGANGLWGWTSIGVQPTVMSATYAPAGFTNFEMSVDLNSFTNVSDKVNVGLNIGAVVGSDNAPASGLKYPTALSATNGTAMIVDGQESDWAAIDNKSVSTAATMTLNAVQDDNKLYLLTQGANLNSQNEYFIDSDNNSTTGDHDSRWPNAGIDYKVSYNTLYRFVGAGNWVKTGSVNNELNMTSSLVYLYLDQLGLASPGQLKVAYVSKNSTALPEVGAPMMSVSSQVHQTVTAGVYYPRESFDVLHNPYMGFMPWARGVETPSKELLKNTPYPQNAKILYAGINWKDLEPTKGNFDWAGIEAANQLDYWYSQGAKVNLRIVMDTPGSTVHRDIPDWLYDEIVAEQGVANAGTIYGDVTSRTGFAPNYNSQVLISEHKRMIQAFAEHYDNDPRISYIQLGSLGHWGEFHNTYVNAPLGNFPKVSVSDQYVQPYIDNFHNKLLGMRKPFPITASNKLGLFNDIIGDKGSTETWKDWTVNGWGDVGLFLEPGQNAAAAKTASAMPDFWKTNFSGGEFTSNISLPNHFTDDYIMEQLNEIRYSHTSWVGPNSPAKFVVGENGITQNIQENLDSWMKTVGYRYVLESVSHQAQAAAGDAVSIATHWNNKGVAPFYYNWPVAVALADANGNVVASSVTKANQTDIRSWLPGGNDANLPLQIPADLASGTYKVLVSVIAPDTNKPGIDLAIAGKRSDGWYPIDQIQVSNGSTPATASVVLSGPQKVTTTGHVALQFGVTSAQQVTAQDVVIKYDAQKFTFDNAVSLDSKSAIQDVDNDSVAGTVRLIVVNTGAGNALNGDQPALLKINFTPVASAEGTGIFSVEQAAFSDAAGEVTSANVTGAAVSVEIISSTALTAAIETAQDKLAHAVAGIQVGQYPASAKSKLQVALDAAQSVAGNSSATQAELSSAAAALNSAIAVFNSLVITSTTGDVNNKVGIDIGDVGVIAAHYGSKVGDSGWKATWDFDGDGEVGLYELAFVVRRLLNH